MEWQRTSAIDLPQTRDPRAHAEPSSLPILTVFGEQLVISDLQRTGTNQTHIRAQNIEQLRKFVNAGFPQEASDGCEPGIVLDFEYRPLDFIQVLEVTQPFFRIHNHGAELVNRKDALVQTNTFLYEEYRPWRGELDEQRGQQQDGRNRDQQ